MKSKRCPCGIGPATHAHNDPRASERVTIVIRAPQGWGKGWFGKMIAQELSKWKGIKVALLDADAPAKYYGPRGQKVGARVSLGQPI